MITNEIAISKVEYDHLKTAEMTLNMYRKAAMKCSKYSDWRQRPMVMDDEDFLELVSMFDPLTYEDIERRCEREKTKAEKEKAATAPEIKAVLEYVAKEGEV